MTDEGKAVQFVNLARRQDNDGLPYFQAVWLIELLTESFNKARAEERERAADLAEHLGDNEIAAAIRSGKP